MTPAESAPDAVPIQIVAEDSEQQCGHCADYGAGADDSLRDTDVHSAKKRPEQGQIGGYQRELATAEERVRRFAMSLRTTSPRGNVCPHCVGLPLAAINSRACS